MMGVKARVASRDAQEFDVDAMLIGHVQQTDRPRRHRAARESALIDDDQGIEGIAVLGQGVGHETVVSRVVHRGVQDPVQPDPVGVVIHLVLVATAPRDLHHDIDGLGSRLWLSQ